MVLRRLNCATGDAAVGSHSAEGIALLYRPVLSALADIGNYRHESLFLAGKRSQTTARITIESLEVFRGVVDRNSQCAARLQEMVEALSRHATDLDTEIGLFRL